MTILICVWVFRDPARAYRVMTGKALPDFTPHKAVTLAQASGWTLPPELAHLPPRTVQIKPVDAIGFFVDPAFRILITVVFWVLFLLFLTGFPHNSPLQPQVDGGDLRYLVLVFSFLIMAAGFAFSSLAALRRHLRILGLAKDLMEMGTATRGVITYLYVGSGRSGSWFVHYQFAARDNQVTNATIKNYPHPFGCRMAVGGEITVLYDPSNFERSIPYILCPFKVLGQS